MDTLGESLPKEIKRNQELVLLYKALPGGAGTFGATLIQNSIDVGVAALASGDVVRMLQAYKILKMYK